MTYEEMAVDPAGEVLDADTIALITQLGASLSQRAVELAEENRMLRMNGVRGYTELRDEFERHLRGCNEVRENRDLLRREINERNQLISGLRAHIELAWSALASAGIEKGPDLPLADAIRTLADTPLDALPAPDVTNADHNAFVSDWFGELTDEQLGFRDDPSTFEVRPGEHLGDVVREQILMLVERLDAKAADDARRAHDIDIVADLCAGDRFLAAQIVDALNVNGIR